MKNLNFLNKISDSYYNLSTAIVKISFIRKLKNGKYRVVSRKGKNLGTYDTKREAEERLKQIETFKHLKKQASKADKIDLSKIEDFSYSSIMRKINIQRGQGVAKEFASIFKKIFDKKILEGDDNPEKETLEETVEIFNQSYPLVFKKNSPFHDNVSRSL